MVSVGLRIRNERQALHWSLKELAAKAGISTMTLQRIETGKTSPSVSVLAEIANHLRKPIDYFFQEKEPKILVIKKEKLSVVESSGMKLTIIAPPDLTGKNVLVNLGEAKEGSFIDPHVEEGHSLVYVLEGDAVLEHDGVEHYLKEGDVVYYDARYSHSVRALSKKQRRDKRVKERLEELNAAKTKTLLGGGRQRIDRQHKAGKLTARERIDLLLDPGSFQEWNMLLGHNHGLPAEGVVTGAGMIHGRPVCVFSQNATVAGGSMSHWHGFKVHRTIERAIEMLVPVIGLFDSPGARVEKPDDGGNKKDTYPFFAIPANQIQEFKAFQTAR